MKHTKTKQRFKISRTNKPSHLTLEQWQVALRREFGQAQNFRLKNIGQRPIFSEFIITNPATECSYRVSIRSETLGDNFCSCPDFTVNTLGTCKHIEFTLGRLRRKREGRKALSRGFSPPFSEVFLRYGAQRRAVFSSGTEAPFALKKLAKKYFDENNILRDIGFKQFDTFLKDAGGLNHELRCYDDALAFIAEIRDADYRRLHLKKIFPDGIESKAFAKLLKIPMYSYQRKGTLFAVKAGRVLIGDDMGLGKTVQAVAAAEIMAREFGVERVLIICPTTLKYQWKSEIERFSERSACVIEGIFHKRRRLYADEAFFKIVNYDVVYRDLELIANLSPDLVILDEAQRIKNWKTRTARSVKQIKSPYAIVLTGTPLENRLEELHSIVEFIDRYRLGPMFRFLDNHQQAASAVINMDLPWNPAVLEQRIGRVHRLGQHRPVRVINFVSEGTIEHGMLSVLSFKRSLFAGVLDAGEDNIFLGKNRLKKFMESVETVTGAIPETDHETPPAEPEIPIEAKTAPESVAEPWQELLSTGAAFLQALGKKTAGSQKAGRPDLTTLLERDEKTGKSYLKIPLPDKEVIQSTLPAINSLLDALKSLMR